MVFKSLISQVLWSTSFSTIYLFWHTEFHTFWGLLLAYLWYRSICFSVHCIFYKLAPEAWSDSDWILGQKPKGMVCSFFRKHTVLCFHYVNSYCFSMAGFINFNAVVKWCYSNVLLICYLLIWICLQRDTYHPGFGYPGYSSYRKGWINAWFFPSYTRFQGNELAYYHVQHSKVTD